jgi:hypothetical protein
MGAHSDMRQVMRATYDTTVKEIPIIAVGRRAMVAIAALSALVYLPSLGVGFLADDYVMLQTLDRLSSLSVFTHNDIGGSDGGHFYRPLWLLWDRWMLALPGDSVAFHAGNLLLYATCVLLVVVLARRLGTPPWRALAAGVVFAVYPRHAEAVAWVAGNTELVCAVPLLGSVVLLLAPRASVRALAAAVALAAVAALTKETAFSLPFLGILVVLTTPGDVSMRRRRLVAVGSMTMVLVALFVVRYAVLNGIGGEIDERLTPGRLGVVLLSQLLAALSWAQLTVLTRPALLAVPAVLGLLVVVSVISLWSRRGESSLASRLRIALVGVGWFFLALLPLANSAVDLNTANGERLLFVPSVGLALLLAVLLPESLRSRDSRLAIARVPQMATLVCLSLVLLLTLASVLEYVAAGRIARRVIPAAARLAPPTGTLVVLDVPDSFRSARLLGAGFDAAVAREGRPDTRVVVCLPVVIRVDGLHSVELRHTARGRFHGTTDEGMPFDFPLSGREVGTAGCRYAPAAKGFAPGLGTVGRATTTDRQQPRVVVIFDGRDLLRCQETDTVCSRRSNGGAR